ncbi:I20L2 protein, partial [Halcyon senegalensis]|nr:I20L2 protein [Halcyon senegalensis]
MADLLLNINFNPSPRPGKKEPGNRKHESFVRRRRALERRRVLKQKQLPVAQPQKKPRCRGRRGRRQRAEDKGPEKAKPLEVKPSPAANGHARAPRGGIPAPGDGIPAPGSIPAPDTVPVSRKPPRPPKPAPADGEKAKTKRKTPGVPPRPTKLVAIDCEMVGTGPGGRTSALARCSIVGYAGDVLYDRYVRPAAPVVDYRTRWSGIRRRHMRDAVPFDRARREILRLLRGRVVVGHSVHNDFRALGYFHPKELTRDTAQIPLLNRKGGFPENVAISLKRLTKKLLHRDIQVSSSSSSS